MLDVPAIRRRAADGTADLADVRALLAEVKRLNRRLDAAILETAANAGGWKAVSLLLARTYRLAWGRGERRGAKRTAARAAARAPEGKRAA